MPVDKLLLITDNQIFSIEDFRFEEKQMMEFSVMKTAESQ